MHTLIGTVTPVSAPAARASAIACLMTPRSAPSVRLKWVYHWYFSRLVRIACCGLGMVSLSTTFRGRLGLLVLSQNAALRRQRRRGREHRDEDVDEVGHE